MGFTPRQRPRRSCEKCTVEKGSSEPGTRTRGDHESVTPLPKVQRKGKTGSWIWKDASSGNFTNLEDSVSTSSSTIPAADEQENSQDHRQKAKPHGPGQEEDKSMLVQKPCFTV